jgi:hypothetical protein
MSALFFDYTILPDGSISSKREWTEESLRLLYPRRGVLDRLSSSLAPTDFHQFSMGPFTVSWSTQKPGACFDLALGNIPVTMNILLPGKNLDENVQFQELDNMIGGLELNNIREYRSINDRPLLALLILPGSLLIGRHDIEFAGYLETAIAATFFSCHTGSVVGRQRRGRPA